MQRTFHKQFFWAIGLAALAVLMFAEFFNVPHIHAQSQAQDVAATAPHYEYDIFSIKPSKPDTGAGMIVGMIDTPDGFTGEYVPLMFLVQAAYGVNSYQVSGAPSWFSAEMYEVNAKMDPTVADALQKLTPEERKLVRRKMLQALLVDRLKLVIHRDTKEQQLYTLVVAKNGPRFQESKPLDTSATESKAPNGGGPRGRIIAGGEDGMQTMTYQASPIGSLVGYLRLQLRATVLDKTGLTGVYDFKLKWMREQRRTQVPVSGVPEGQPSVAATDPIGPTLLDALQDQLGLKLESGKGPVEIIVIDHIERPSGN
jgi:uncharacterized protein (TIGR03435 family)